MIYLDNAATTKPCDECLKIYDEINKIYYFNPSSGYSASFNLNKQINEIKKDFIKYLGGIEGDNIIFTSGATESNNIAILGSCTNKQKKYLFSVGEHPSVYNCACELRNKGYNIEFIPLQRNGQIDYEKFEKMCTSDVCFVSTMLVSNETGAINDIDKIRNIINNKAKDAIFHVDAVQGFGKIKFSALKSKINLCSISAHKIEGIKGIGGLYISKNTRIKNINYGGGQENNLRSGTINAAGIFSFHTSATIAIKNLEENYKKLTELKEYLLKNLKKQIDNNKFIIVSEDINSPYIISLLFKGKRGETIMRYLDSKGIYISTGSACSTNKIGNRILENMGYKKDEIMGAVRISLNKNNTKEELDVFINNLSNYFQEINT